MTHVPAPRPEKRQMPSFDPALPPVLAEKAELLFTDRLKGPLPAETLPVLAQSRAAVGAMMAPPAELQMWRWLRGLDELATLPRAPAGDEAWKKAAMGVWLVANDLPAGVWCVETQAALLRRCAFWPVPKEVYEVLEAFAGRIRLAHFRLEQLARHHEQAVRAAEKVRADDLEAEIVSELRPPPVRSMRPPGAPWQASPRPDTPRPAYRQSAVDRRSLIAELAHQAAHGPSAGIREVASARLARLRQELQQPPQAPMGAERKG